jgi:hypothetical protein
MRQSGSILLTLRNFSRGGKRRVDNQAAMVTEIGAIDPVFPYCEQIPISSAFLARLDTSARKVRQSPLLICAARQIGVR